MKLRKLLKLLGALVALVVITLIAIPFFVSADYLKAQLVAQVKQATGRELVIKGKASLSLFPNVAVVVEDVTLGNPAGFTSPYFVTVKKLETGAALKPLLSKELRITGIAVEGAVLNLEETKAGAKNWEFAAPGGGSSAAKSKDVAKADDAASSPALNGFAIGDITLKDSAVHYMKPGAATIAVKDILLTVHGADGNAPLAIEGSVRYQDAPVKLQLTVDALQAALSGEATPAMVALSLPDGSVKFEGKASMKERPNVDGALAVSIGNLPKLLAWATAKPAPVGLPKQVELTSVLALKGAQAVTLSDLSLTVDALKAEGKLALNLTGAVPALQGALSLGEVDLDALLASQEKTAPAKATAAKTRPKATSAEGWSRAPIDLSGLRAANANLDLKLAALKVSNLEIHDIATSIALNQGNLKLNLGNASLYSGTAKGTVMLDGSSSVPSMATNLALTDIQIDPLMTAMSGASRLSGVGNVSLVLNAQGSSQYAMVNALGGKGAIRLTDGAVKGINIAQFLRNAKKGFLFGDNSTEKTDFTELAASFEIAKGLLSNKDLSMKSPILRLAGSGTANLPARLLNYRLVPTLVGTLQGQGGKEAAGLAIPLLIAGPWSNPTVTPDVKGIIEDSLKNPELLKQNLKDINGTIKQFNSPKDIGKALLGGLGNGQPQPATEGGAQPDPVQQGIGNLLNSLQKK